MHQPINIFYRIDHSKWSDPQTDLYSLEQQYAVLLQLQMILMKNADSTNELLVNDLIAFANQLRIIIAARYKEMHNVKI